MVDIEASCISGTLAHYIYRRYFATETSRQQEGQHWCWTQVLEPWRFSLYSLELTCRHLEPSLFLKAAYSSRTFSGP